MDKIDKILQKHFRAENKKIIEEANIPADEYPGLLSDGELYDFYLATKDVLEAERRKSPLLSKPKDFSLQFLHAYAKNELHARTIEKFGVGTPRDILETKAKSRLDMEKTEMTQDEIDELTTKLGLTKGLPKKEMTTEDRLLDFWSDKQIAYFKKSLELVRAKGYIAEFVQSPFRNYAHIAQMQIAYRNGLDGEVGYITPMEAEAEALPDLNKKLGRSERMKELEKARREGWKSISTPFDGIVYDRECDSLNLWQQIAVDASHGISTPSPERGRTTPDPEGEKFLKEKYGDLAPL
ncbi:MAG: hypothetical protein FWC00_04855 [Firmicutes bacterium]|nr:hypothetical protein [Bacillota bacterium]